MTPGFRQIGRHPVSTVHPGCFIVYNGRYREVDYVDTDDYGVTVRLVGGDTKFYGWFSRPVAFGPPSQPNISVYEKVTA